MSLENFKRQLQNRPQEIKALQNVTPSSEGKLNVVQPMNEQFAREIDISREIWTYYVADKFTSLASLIPHDQLIEKKGDWTDPNVQHQFRYASQNGRKLIQTYHEATRRPTGIGDMPHGHYSYEIGKEELLDDVLRFIIYSSEMTHSNAKTYKIRLRAEHSFWRILPKEKLPYFLSYNGALLQDRGKDINLPDVYELHSAGRIIGVDLEYANILNEKTLPKFIHSIDTSLVQLYDSYLAASGQM